MSRPLLLAALLAWSAPAMAGPLDPWGAHVGKGVFALTPFLFVDQSPDFYPSVYGQYGFTDSFELLGGVSGEVYAVGSSAGGTGDAGFFGPIELMPRYFFHETTAGALHVSWNPTETDVTLAPELHGVYTLGPIELTANVGWSPTVGASGFSPGTVGAIIAPEYYFNDATSVFVEVNPTVDLTALDTAPLALEVVPGVGTAIADTHYFSFGVAIPVVDFDPSGIYGGMWYSVSFGGSDEEEAPEAPSGTW